MTLAGSKRERKGLKVPLAKTSCGQDTFILWQVDVDETEASRQLIKSEYCAENVRWCTDF